MDRLLDLHVALPMNMAKSLDRLARSRGLKRAQLLRFAVEQFLAQAAREARDAEMKAYAEEMAPHSGEFVRETGRSVARLLLEETKW